MPDTGTGRPRGRPRSGEPAKEAISVRFNPRHLEDAKKAAVRLGDTVSSAANRLIGAYAKIHHEGWELAGEIAQLPEVNKPQQLIFEELTGLITDIRWRRMRAPTGERLSLLSDEDIAFNAGRLDRWLMADSEWVEYPGWEEWVWSPGADKPALDKGSPGYRLVMCAWEAARAVRQALRI